MSYFINMCIQSVKIEEKQNISGNPSDNLFFTLKIINKSQIQSYYIFITFF